MADNPVVGGEVEEAAMAALDRPARALIGWMDPEEARLVQAGRRMDLADSPDFEVRAREARQAVASREIGLDQSDLLQEPPADLDDHVDQLRKHPASQGMFNEGWRVAIADLQRVCAIQPSVFVDRAEERVHDVDLQDLQALANATLPIPAAGRQLPAQFDNVRQAWIFASPNPNLRVLGNWGGEIQPGITGFGFAIQLSPSFLQVAGFRGRYLLRDGYHRAYGLLARGLQFAPVFTRDYPTFESLGLNPGMLPQDAYLGDRPALLPDYLDERVAADVRLPAAQKMIVIQALELTPLG